MDVSYDLGLIEKELFNKDIDDKDFMVFKDRIIDADNLTKEVLVSEVTSFILSLLNEVKSEEEFSESNYSRYDEGYDEGYDDGKEEGYSRGFDDGYEEGYEMGIDEGKRS